MLVGRVNATTYVNGYYTVTNKCAVVKDNKVVIPVTVRITNDKVKLSNLIEEYNLGYVDNYEDVLKLNIYGVNRDGMNVYVDYKRDSYGKSLILFNIDDNIELKRHEELVSFNIGVEILNNTEVDKIHVLDNEVVLGDESVCETINGYKVNEIVRYVELSESDHTEYINDLLTKVIIGVLSVALIVCVYLLFKRKK